MKYKHVLSLDPSGNYHEGKGTTGWAFSISGSIKQSGHISALQFPNKESFWEAQISIIQSFRKKYGPSFIVVIEDYLLYANKAESQINSRMETCKLIGALQVFCYQHNIPYCMQPASEVKTRWSNEILLAEGIIGRDRHGYYLPATHERINRHAIDAIRHNIHFTSFKNNAEAQRKTKKHNRTTSSY